MRAARAAMLAFCRAAARRYANMMLLRGENAVCAIAIDYFRHYFFSSAERHYWRCQRCRYAATPALPPAMRHFHADTLRCCFMAVSTLRADMPLRHAAPSYGISASCCCRRQLITLRYMPALPLLLPL